MATSSASSVAKRPDSSPGNALIKQLRADLQALEPQIANALPAHMPVARFNRVVMTALQNNPKLQACDKQSLWNACMQAAQDGLLPDGREGAIVPYGTDENGNSRSDIARWMPMVYGLRKKVRNAGVLTDWNVQVVQAGDEFAFELGDQPFIHHKPSLKGGSKRAVIAAYSIATFPDGTKSREVMNADQLEDIRKLSKAKKGPWSVPEFYSEMCRKTVARRHAKQLPQSTDLDTVLRRDDDLYDFAGAREEGRRAIPGPGSARAVLDQFAAGPQKALPPADDDDEAHDEDGVIEGRQAAPPQEGGGAPQEGRAAPSEERAPASPPQGQAAPQGPRNEADYRAYAEAIITEARDAKTLAEWWASAAQRKMRNTAGIVVEVFNEIERTVKARCAELESGGAG